MAGAFAGPALFLAGLVGMEGVAWATHRYLMHGPLWVWHRSHHGARRAPFELNDLFGLVFAGLAIALFAVGAEPGRGLLSWLAAGITAYGALYVLVHDGLVHRRFPLPVRADRGYLRRLVQAHRLHHAVQERTGCVSFGFLAPGRPSRLARRLKQARARSGVPS